MNSPSFGSTRVSRRQFLAVTGAVLALPTLIPSRVLGATSPSERINLAVVGGGNQGNINLKAFLGLKQCQVVAVCDVDKGHLANTVNVVNDHYQNHDCKPYHDFRELLARKDIDR